MFKIKIAFIGTHGTGKTTLAYYLTAHMKKIGMNVHMITETARKCPFPINENPHPLAEMWIVTKQINEEITANKDFEHIVCDRSVLDAYVYKLFTTGEDKIIKNIVEDWINTYDYLFKVPINRPLVADGIRSINTKFQDGVDKQMDRVIADNKLKIHTLPTKNQFEFLKKTLGLPDKPKTRQEALTGFTSEEHSFI